MFVCLSFTQRGSRSDEMFSSCEPAFQVTLHAMDWQMDDTVRQYIDFCPCLLLEAFGGARPSSSRFTPPPRGNLCKTYATCRWWLMYLLLLSVIVRICKFQACTQRTAMGDTAANGRYRKTIKMLCLPPSGGARSTSSLLTLSPRGIVCPTYIRVDG